MPALVQPNLIDFYNNLFIGLPLIYCGYGKCNLGMVKVKDNASQQLSLVTAQGRPLSSLLGAPNGCFAFACLLACE